MALIAIIPGFIVLLYALMALIALMRRKSWKASRPLPARLVHVSQKEKSRVAGILARLVRCRTVSYPDEALMDWTEFGSMRRELAEAFPLVHQKLGMEIVGTAALVYRWDGADASLEPVLLTAHQDVVPPGDSSEWTHGPFDGEIADGFVWGRGAFDVKLQIAGILSAIEKLLGEGFVPQRTVFAAFGCNEEVGGESAAEIAKRFSAQGLHFHMVLDEGGAVMESLMKQIRSPAAVVGIAEKGNANLLLEVRKHGGHSSTPDNPTSVGILGRALDRLESRQMPSRLVAPMKQFLLTAGAASTGMVSLLFSNLWLTRPLVLKALGSVPDMAAFVRTTHAATMCKGSEVCNVIPEEASAIVNFRLLGDDDGEAVMRWAGRVINDKRVSVSLQDKPVLQSKASPVDCKQFRDLESVISAVFSGTITVPYCMAGATDAKSYACVSEHIYRFTPALMDFGELGRMHGTDERISLDNIGRALCFYLTFINQVCS